MERTGQANLDPFTLAIRVRLDAHCPSAELTEEGVKFCTLGQHTQKPLCFCARSAFVLGIEFVMSTTSIGEENGVVSAL